MNAAALPLPPSQWWRQFALLLVPLASLTLLMCLWLHHAERTAVLDSTAAACESQLKAIGADVSVAMSESATDALVVSVNPSVTQVAGSAEGGWQPIGDILVQLLRSKPIYDRARVLDLNGDERTGVSLNGGDPMLVPQRELKNERGKEYFELARNLGRGKVFVSSMDLQTEGGKPVTPFKALVRFVTPIYDADGIKRGLLVLDLIANQLLEQIHESAPEHVDIWLVDQSGQWMMGGLPEDEFNRQTGKGMSLAERNPVLFNAMVHGDLSHLVQDGDLWVFHKMQPVETGARQRLSGLPVKMVSSLRNDAWYLVLHYDADALAILMAQSGRTITWFAVLAGVLSVAISALLATFFRRSAAKATAEAAYFRLFEHAPVGVVVLDAVGNGLFFNQAWTELSGMDADVSLDSGWLTCVDANDQAALREAWRKVDELNVEQFIEVRLRRPDARVRWAACRVAHVPPDFGGRARFTVSVGDSHLHKEHEARIAAALQLLEGVVAGSGDPILSIDLGYRITLLNPSFGQSFGMLYGNTPAVGDCLADWLEHWPVDRDALMAQFGHACNGQTNHVRLSLGPTKRLYDCAFSPLYRSDGAASGAILFARDVTEMARMQGRVARNEELFRAVFAGSLDAVFVFEAVRDRFAVVVDFRYVEVSGPPVNQMGRRRDEYVGKLVSERNPVFTRELGYIAHFIHVMNTGEPFIEERFMDGDGVPAGWYENRVVTLGWGVTLTSRNITSRKNAELALEASEALQRNILDSSPYCIVAVDADGLVTVFNRAAEQMLGYRAEDVVGKQTPMLFHDTREVARRAIELSNLLGETIEPGMQVFRTIAERNDTEAREWTFITQDKQRIPVLMSLSPRRRPDGKIVGNMGIAYDIRRQKEAEAERDRLYAVVEAIPDMVAMADLTGKVIYLNEAGRKLRGVEAGATLEGLHISRPWTEWSFNLLQKVALPQALSGKAWTGDTQMVLPNGDILDVRQLLVAPRMGGSEPSFTATVIHDLSEVRAMEAKMVEEDALLNSILESVQDAIVVLDEAGKVQSLNPAVADVFRYGLHEVIGREVSMLLTDNCAKQLLDDMAQYLKASARRFTAIRREVQGRHKRGTLFPMELTMSEIKFVDHRIYTVVMRDISERKAAEAKLLENIAELQETQKALASANQQLLEFNTELNRMAQMDGLTGVANRRAFDQTLAAEWGRAARNATALTLLMLDVDHFKLFNDGYGHQMGDECLKAVAGVLRESVVRPSDFVARYGGEEFAIILPDTDNAGALEVAERVRTTLAKVALPHAYSPTSDYVTVSIGAASVVPLGGVAPTVLLSAADRALYRAKETGRNRVFAGA